MAAQHDGSANPVGAPVPGWTARALPPATPMRGRFCTVEPLDPARHGAGLAAASADDPPGHWTYLPHERPADGRAYLAWAASIAGHDDPMYHAIVDRGTGRAVGVAAYMRIDRGNGCIELGGLNFAAPLQRTPAATEAMFLMLARAFDELGYRRCEWKCDSLNAPSHAAAARLGFRHEGVFRQAVVTKGRNRDTAWFAIIDREWPALRAGFLRWLAAENFAADGRQRRSLAACRAGVD